MTSTVQFSRNLGRFRLAKFLSAYKQVRRRGSRIVDADVREGWQQKARLLGQSQEGRGQSSVFLSLSRGAAIIMTVDCVNMSISSRVSQEIGQTPILLEAMKQNLSNLIDIRNLRKK